MYTLKITGFKSKKDVELFYQWFENVGEQDLWNAWNHFSNKTKNKSPMTICGKKLEFKEKVGTFEISQ